MDLQDHGWSPQARGEGSAGLTLPPERDALLLVGLADAVVAVAVHVVAGVPVVQVDVGGAVGVGAGAELGQVAGVARLPAGRARRLQLRGREAGHERESTPSDPEGRGGEPDLAGLLYLPWNSKQCRQIHGHRSPWGTRRGEIKR